MIRSPQLAAAVLAVAALPAAAAPRVQDDSGHTIDLAQPARRIVALGPHLTELVYAAGGGERLAGVLRYSDYPPAALAKPVVGDAIALNLEAIAGLKPDLIVVWRSGINERQRARLAGLQVPVFESEITSVAGIAAMLRTLGTLMATTPQAETAAARIEGDWRALQSEYAGRAPVRTFYQLWSDPLMTLNGEHLISRAITACGGVNVFAGLPTLTASVSRESAVRADPELIVTASAPDDAAALERWREFPQVAAVKRGMLAGIDGSLISRMGPRFVDAARRLCETIDRARPPR